MEDHEQVLNAEISEPIAGGNGPSSSYGPGAYGGGQIVGHGIVQAWNAWSDLVGPPGADVIEFFFPIENQVN